METTEKEGERVRTNTGQKQNAEIDNQIMENLKPYTHKGKAAMEARIKELGKEWDMERTLELNAATLALAGTLLATFVNKKWWILPAVVTSFLVQHAVQGWCPPVPVFRSMGIRTRPEIDREMYALKALRGDFKKVDNVNQAWAAVN